MSRYTGPSWKQSRRLGLSLTGTGKELARRNYVPGQHGPNNRSKLSEYGLQLAEKQKLRFSYGLGEKQFRNLFVQALKLKKELSVSTSCFFWNVVWITLFTVLDLRLLVVKLVNSLTTVTSLLTENALISLHTA